MTPLFLDRKDRYDRSISLRFNEALRNFRCTLRFTSLRRFRGSQRGRAQRRERLDGGTAAVEVVGRSSQALVCLVEGEAHAQIRVSQIQSTRRKNS